MENPHYTPNLVQYQPGPPEASVETPAYYPQSAPGVQDPTADEGLAHQTDGLSLQPVSQYPTRYNSGYQRLVNDDPQQYEQDERHLASAVASNNSTTVVISQPSHDAVTAGFPYIEDNMALSLLTCVFCCWCIGIFAILKSFQVRKRLSIGNYEGALASAKTAKIVGIAAMIFGIWTYIILHFLIFHYSSLTSG